ncbi:DUF2735 domain-containing protein [Rhizobium sp. LCM 4573]|uniref:DUF2735 domain-containing protein n=1 Tax=Rhizobium sp. LCM 4573 TaxID=1848291 RepID=UPI0008D9C96D|nr:DUF2735 domain-containing protein [Rhizobium sp. LCM 4573]OHV84256.1 hypothetical protein LCM4573_00705 [Rhizobium sp. LCM 4573]
MNANSERVSAKIYQFPLKGLRPNRDLQRARPDIDAAAADFSDAAFGGCWYHEEAIKDSRQDRD